MTQKLTVKIKQPDGSEAVKSVTVLRSWQDSDGGHVFLHTNGVYGHLNGAPVRNRDELAVIRAPYHLRAAVMWWKRTGEKLAEDYYAALDEQQAALAGDYRETGTGDTERDMVLYTRLRSDGTGAPEGPFSWMELFSARPDWWGQANQIGFDDWQYARADMEDGAPDDDAGAAADSGAVNAPEPDEQKNVVAAKKAAAGNKKTAAKTLPTDL